MERADNNWTDDIEKLVREWGETADTLEGRYDSQSMRQKIYYYLLMIPIILCNACLTGLTIYNVIEDQLVVKIIIIILTIIDSAAVSLTTLFTFDAASQASGAIAKKYKRLSLKIEAELNRTRAERMDGDEFLEYTRGKYTRLAERSPDLNSNIKHIFMNFCIGKRTVDVPKTITVAAPGITYASTEEVSKVGALDPNKVAAVEQFIEDNNSVAMGERIALDRIPELSI